MVDPGNFFALKLCQENSENLVLKYLHFNYLFIFKAYKAKRYHSLNDANTGGSADDSVERLRSDPNDPNILTYRAADKYLLRSDFIARQFIERMRSSESTQLKGRIMTAEGWTRGSSAVQDFVSKEG